MYRVFDEDFDTLGKGALAKDKLRNMYPAIAETWRPENVLSVDDRIQCIKDAAQDNDSDSVLEHIALNDPYEDVRYAALIGLKKLNTCKKSMLLDVIYSQKFKTASVLAIRLLHEMHEKDAQSIRI